MIGHKVVPSRRGGIERVLTIMCPLMIKKGHQVTCFNRSGDKVENEYVKTVKGKKYRGVQLKKVITTGYPYARHPLIEKTMDDHHKRFRFQH